MIPKCQLTKISQTSIFINDSAMRVLQHSLKQNSRMKLQSHFCVYSPNFESRVSKRYWCAWVLSSDIHKRSREKCNPVGERMNKMKLNYKIPQYLVLKQKKILSRATIWMNLEKTTTVKRVRFKSEILYDFTHVQDTRAIVYRGRKQKGSFRDGRRTGCGKSVYWIRKKSVLEMVAQLF